MKMRLLVVMVARALRRFLFVVMLFAMVMAAAIAEGQRFVQEKFDYLSDLHLGWHIRKKCRPVGFLIYG